jgi:mono/diheme cytochrome c family protein
LGPGRQPALTIIQFAALMWNHAPAMRSSPLSRGMPRPVFQDQQVADVVAFLAGLRASDPAGSPQIGSTVFLQAGCGGCHGPEGQGDRFGPALRGRGSPTTSVTLAAAFWQHGAAMQRRASLTGREWPTLTGDDIGDLVAYLNAPPGKR